MQDSASFWTDIKNLEEQLAEAPDAYCFAKLSDIYLKVGLVDDALHIARQGVMKHPRYLSGQRALSQACYAKGLIDESLDALKYIVEVLPEDIVSQKLLGRILIGCGNQKEALEVFRTALEFAPDDVECLIEFETLGRSTQRSESDNELHEGDEEVLEDLEILDDIDIVEDEQQLEPALDFNEAAVEPERINYVSHHDPLSTATLAELYVSQGFIQKALEIYRTLLADNPSDRLVAERIFHLESSNSVALDSVPDECNTSETVVKHEASDNIHPEAFVPLAESVVQPEPDALLPVFEGLPACTVGQIHENVFLSIPHDGAADNALAIFDRWLENIRRIKSCH